MAYERGRDPTAVMGRRITAFVIDLLIIGVIVSIFFRPDITRYDKTADGTVTCAQVQIIEDAGTCIDSDTELVLIDFNLFGAVMLQLGLWFLNAVLIQGATGATVGKTLLGLRCVKANGEICGIGAAFIRTVLLLVDYALCFLVGLITAMVSRGHQRLGDMAAHTYVIRTSSLATLTTAQPPAEPTPWSPPPSGGPVPSEWTPPGPDAPPPGPASPPPWSPN